MNQRIPRGRGAAPAARGASAGWGVLVVLLAAFVLGGPVCGKGNDKGNGNAPADGGTGKQKDKGVKQKDKGPGWDGALDGGAPDAPGQVDLLPALEGPLPFDLLPRPDAPAADQTAPDQQVPDLLPPDHALPDQMAPDHALPDQMVPDQMLPDQMLPDQLVPDQLVPDQLLPDQMLPDLLQPDIAPATACALSWTSYAQNSSSGAFGQVSGYCCGTRYRVEAGDNLTVKGVARDCSGAPAPSAPVTVTVTVDTGQSKSATVRSDGSGAFSAVIKVPYATGTHTWKLGTRCHQYNLGTVKITSGSASWTDDIYVFQYSYYCP